MSKTINEKTYQVTCADEVDKKWFKECLKVGISAGASTPDYLIRSVSDRIQEIADNK